MRTLLMATAALVGAAGLTGAVLRWPDKADTAKTGSDAGASRPALRRLASADKVERDQLQRQLSHLTEGNLVPDMRALESLDAAQTLVLHWRSNHPVDTQLVCWLAATDDNDLSNVVGALSEAGFSALRVHVALDEGSAPKSTEQTLQFR
jgi:hypothetical protein